MKKIVFLVPSLMMGGMEKVLVTYANLFSRGGYDVTVLNLTRDDKNVTDGFDSHIHYQNNYAPVPNVIHATVGDMLHLNFRLLPWKRWIKFHSPKFLHKKYIKEKYDVEVAFLGIELTKIISGGNCEECKQIAWIHSTNNETFVPKGYSLYQAKKIYSDIQNIICVSDIGKRKIEEYYGRKNQVYVLHNPIDDKNIRVLSKEKVKKTNAFTFINVSRLSDKSKGLIRLLEVCKRLVDEGEEFNLWLVGDGPDREIIEQKIKSLGLHNVILWGQQANPYKYMAAADAYICSSYYEGYSITIAEAVSLGMIIVTTDVSGMRDMLGDSEYGLIVENNAEGIHSGMRQILTNRKLYEKYKNAVVCRKDLLSSKRVVQFIEELN